MQREERMKRVKVRETGEGKKRGKVSDSEKWKRRE